jgi:sugar transferase (PEP-CTERM/EpsH1 system associated)
MNLVNGQAFGLESSVSDSSDRDTVTKTSTSSIRVAHLVNHLDVGGLENVVFNLVRFADRSRIQPSVICLHGKGTLAPRVEKLGIEVKTLNGTGVSRLRLMGRLIRQLRRDGINVLHTHNPMPHLLGAPAALAARVPVLVHTKHGRNRPSNRRLVRLNRMASWLSNKIVGVSRDSIDVARNVERVSPGKLELIHNGIDLEAFRPAHTPRDAAAAIHVARLNPIKDQPTLLQAVRRVADSMPNFRLQIVGDGAERARLEEISRQLQLQDHVYFLGERSDVSELLARAGLFVLSSVSEGLSLTLLEAMAGGLPVVATNVGGNAEVVVEGETGLLTPPRSPELLAEAMLALMRDPNRAKRMGEAGRRRVEREFDARQVARRYESLYARLLFGESR